MGNVQFGDQLTLPRCNSQLDSELPKIEGTRWMFPLSNPRQETSWVGYIHPNRTHELVNKCNGDFADNDESATVTEIIRYCAILNRRTLASVGMLLDEQTPGGGLFKLTSQNSS